MALTLSAIDKKKGTFLSAFLVFSLLSLGQQYDSTITLPKADKVSTEEKVPQNSIKNDWTGNVIIVYKTHFDIGYSERIREVVHDYRTSMADNVLNAIEKNKNQPPEKQFVWTLSGWPMTQILGPGQNPVRRHEIEQALTKGNLAVHAFPFTMHSESSALEDMVRGLNISSSLLRKYGKPLSISAKTTDVPGHSWLLPTLCAHAGIKFYHFGGSVVNKDLGLPLLFWWEGPDGSRLLTLYNNSYGSNPLPPVDWPFNTWIYLNMTGDNQGPPDPSTVEKDLEFFKERGVKAKVGTMDDFAESLLKEDLSKLPVVRSDIGDTWIHGTMSLPEASKTAQHTRPLIGTLEQITTLEKLWGIYRPDISSIINKAYEQSLLYSEHTWGLANQHYIKVPYGEHWQELWEKGLPLQYQLMQKSWNDQAQYIETTRNLVSDPLYVAVASLADQVNVNQNRIVVYNPLPWKRDGEVAIDTRLVFGNTYNSIEAADDGSKIIVDHGLPAIEDIAPFSRFVVKDIPPMGYRTFVASEVKGQNKPLLVGDSLSKTIESPYFKAVFDPNRGSIISLVDKKTGRELVDTTAPHGFGQYVYERFSFKEISQWLDTSLFPQYQAHKFIFAPYEMPRNTSYQCFYPDSMKLSIQQSEIDVKAILTGTISGRGQPQNISVSLTLSGILPIAKIEVVWQKLPDTWPEAAWIALPFKIDNPAFRLGRLGAVTDPSTDMTVENANHHLWWVNNGLAIYDKKKRAGVGLASSDTPLVSIGEPGDFKFSSMRIPEKPHVYLNLYNNHWRTNFPAWIGKGEQMRAAVTLWSYADYDTEQSLITPALETRIPLQVAASKMPHGNLPPSQAGITLSRKGVEVTAFGQNPDGDGTLFRVWEQAGKSGQLEVSLPPLSFTTALPVNLRGEKIAEAIPLKKGTFSINLPAYAPASFILY